MPQAVATVLGIREQPGRLVLATLAERLSDRKLLILLDNCEHVVAASAELAATLLHACPHLRVLATSRAVLGVSGETTWPVPALSVPDLSHASEPEVVARSEAAQLFVERARAAVPDFALTLETSPAVSEICTRIDGLPLAIELAAAWTRVLSPQELAQRLMHPLPLLVTGARDAPTRQQTLRATLDWSYFLLAPPEQRLLARLSVFAGGATLSAIERVGGDGRESGLAVLPRLARLIDASLVQRLDSSGTEPRYRLLETVRQYAGERLLEQGEQDAIRGRHAALFRDVAEEGRWRLRGPEQAVWLDRLERDHENMRAALA